MNSVEKAGFSAQLNDHEWCAQVVYMAHIVRHLSYLNESMQGQQENVL